MLRFKIIIYYIYYCIKIGAKPWNFSQFNAKYFNNHKGIFSKYEIEENIPEKWKLKSIFLGPSESFDTQKQNIINNFKFPVFLKPEWGQNSHGILVVKDKIELYKQLEKIKESHIVYVCQESCELENEYEILYTKNLPYSDININCITQTISSTKKDFPVNGIHHNSSYKSVIETFNTYDIEKLKGYIEEIGNFNVGRMGLKSKNIQELIKGKFKIFEINIFLPMILSLLDQSITKQKKENSIRIYTKNLAQITKFLPKEINKSIFFRKLFKHYTIKLNNNKIYMKFKKIIYSLVEKKFMNGCSDYNSLEVRKSCRSKKQGRDMFAENDIPHAKGTIFFNPYRAYKFVKKHGFPVCIKPNVGGYSRGSHFPISTWKEFWKACFMVKVWWPTSVIESYLFGKNYRVVATKTGGIEIAMQRYPGSVVGDGKKTISNLIDDENKTRTRMKLTPVIHLIEKNKRTKDFLKKQGLSFDSIIKKGREVFVFHRVSLAPGGVLETVDISDITKKNKEIFLKILGLFESNIFGIDVIMKEGIDVDFDKQECIFLEVNSRPYLEMHKFPRYGKAPNMKNLYKDLDELEVTNRGVF